MSDEEKREPRQLAFVHLEEIIPEVRKLQESGYLKLGRWDLSQTCGHLEDWIRYPVEGFPQVKFPLNFVLWVIRKTSGKSAFRKIVAQKGMKRNMPTLPQTVKSAGSASEVEAIAALEAAVNQFANHQGEYHPSPVFGKLSREEATQLQLIHCAHHLSRLLPKIHGSAQ